MSKHGRLYFGKYRGKVENTTDPSQLGRVQVSCPVVLGDGKLSWAMPCTPYAGDGVGLFMIPPTGANVWIEFEGGDPDYPILAGCFWNIGEVPATPALDTIKMLKTDSVSIKIDDTSSAGGVTVEIGSPAVQTEIKLVCDSSGVELTTGEGTFKLTKDSLEISVTSKTSTKLTQDGIEMKGADKSTIKMTDADIQAKNDKSKVTIAADTIELASGSSKTKLEDSGTEVKNGSKSVKISSSSVNINQGALEVM